MFTDSEEQSKINHYNNDTEKHKSDNWQEVSELLDFAANLKVRCDRFLDRIFLLNTLQVFFGFSVIGFSLVIFNLIPGLYLNVNLLLVVLTYFGWILLFFFIEASSKTLKLRVSTDRRVLNSTIDLLRENSSVLAQDWSNLQKIQLEIKLSVFDANTSINPWLKLKNLFEGSFLLWAAGNDVNILNDVRLKGERNKYQHIGAIFCLTALFSFVSVFYALYIVFENAIISTFLGFFWSVMIFNVNRFTMMSTLTKNTANFISHIARLILAILIALTISIPLELRIFQPEIENQVSANNQIIFANTIKGDGQIRKIDDQIFFVVDEINQRNQEAIKLEQRLNLELSGKTSKGNRGFGPIAAIIKERINTLLADISKSEKSKNLLEKQRGARIEVLKNTASLNVKSSGLGTRVEALVQLYREKPIMMSLGYSIRIIIVAIEILPIFSKLLMRDTLYERMLRRKQNELFEKESETQEKMLSQKKEHY